MTSSAEGTASITSKFLMPRPDGVDDENLREVAWHGFQALIADTAKPPAEFTIEFDDA